MGKKEYVFNKLLREELKLLGFNFWRVENHGIDPGMPDLHFVTTERLCGWIEVKDEPSMPRRIAYERNQPTWLIDYSQSGGFCCTVVNIQNENALLYIAAEESLRASQSIRDTSHQKFIGSDRFEYLARTIRTSANAQLRRLLASPKISQAS